MNTLDTAKRQAAPSSSNLKTGTLEPNPQSQSYPRSYGSILQTSLTYFILRTRGCKPWRPDAVMGTIKGANKSVFSAFSRAVGSASDTSNDKVLYQPINLVTRQSDFSEKRLLEKRRQRFPKRSSIAEFLYVTVSYPRAGWRILSPFHFKVQGKTCA